MTNSNPDAVARPVARLVTRVELDRDATTARQLSVSARLDAELADGRRLVLLDDRGWATSVSGGLRDIAHGTTPEEIAETARTVVGPDEPFGGRTQEQMAADHWAALARILRRQGVDADAELLPRLPHDVELGDALRARIG